MALVLNGSGTITGLAEGGIEDAKIINADIKAGTIALDRLSDTGIDNAKFIRGDNTSQCFMNTGSCNDGALEDCNVSSGIMCGDLA